jgi:hypothetical protein
MKIDRFLAFSLAVLAAGAADAQVTIRILLGSGDAESVRWDGTIAAQGGKIASLAPWRFEGADAIVGSAWHLNTHPIRLFNGGTQVSSRGVSNVVANGLIVNVSDTAVGAALKATTAQGDFTVALDELAYGKPVPKLNANFEIFARVIQNGIPGRQVQVSNDPANDVAPVAATDSTGNVWIAWQGWRNGRAAILAATQSGDRFGAAQPVSQSPANEWNPAIAADSNGRVTIAWDSYRNENYDVYMRTAAGGQWGPETPVAASARYEAYPSLAYENTGRLWVAYEEGGKGWGKDFGAYNTAGVSVYQGRAIRLRGFEPDGRVVETTSDIGSVLPGLPSIHFDKAGFQKNFEKLDPDVENAKTRVPDTPARNMQNARNNYPRLAVDASGRIWLAVRSAHPIFWSTLGTVWTEHLISFDGKTWSNSIFLNHSDNLLDNRPALVSTQAGHLLVIGSSDNRRRFDLGEPLRAQKEDPYNNDLYASEVILSPAAQPLAVSATQPVQVAGAQAVADKTDLAMVKAHPRLQGRKRERRFEDRARRIPPPQRDLYGWRRRRHHHRSIPLHLDAGALDWVGCCDHDNGAGREYTWWMTRNSPTCSIRRLFYVPMFSYERSVPYPEGHRNVIFAQRGIRTLPRLPITGENDPGHAPDTLMLYSPI